MNFILRVIVCHWICLRRWEIECDSKFLPYYIKSGLAETQLEGGKCNRDQLRAISVVNIKLNGSIGDRKHWTILGHFWWRVYRM